MRVGAGPVGSCARIRPDPSVRGCRLGATALVLALPVLA
jgi:hypothetical protein